MRRSPLLPCAVLLVLAAAAPARADEPYARLLAEKSDLVVSVKYTLMVTLSAQGRTQDQEVSGSVTGIVVDASGLVMIPNTAIAGPGNVRPGVDLKAVPTELRVVFPGDPKEYPAIVGASDSKVGLAFIRVKDLEGKVVPSLPAEAAADPVVGQVLYGVSRLPQGFDYAPHIGDLRVTGVVTKPRALWDVDGSFLAVAHPVFDASGAVVGVLINQEGVGGGAGIFVLPWKTASGIVQRALKASETALEEAKAKEAEAAAAAAEAPPADAPKEGPKEGPAEQPKEAPKDVPPEAPKDTVPGEAR